MALSSLCSSAFGADESSQVLIEVKKSCVVNTKHFTLGDIADIEAPKYLKEEISQILIGFTPSPGKIKILDGRELKNKLESNKLFSPDINIVVPEKVYIKSSSQEISTDKLKKIFIDYIDQEAGQYEFQVRDFSVRGLELYPQGELSLSLPLHKGRNLKGHVTLYVDVKIDDNDFKRLSLSGSVDIFDQVVCASKYLKRGQILNSQDVHIKKVNTANIRRGYFSFKQDVVGKELTRNIKKDGFITSNMLDEPALVKKGDMVKMVAEKGSMSIVTMGIARSDGKLNDTVRVENIRSKKIINAIVTGQGSVKVLY